ncbi:MAG: hypothetical protein FE78DRAFT_74772 [Acidomyces sp. 'richmondensis']|nr:MAG: hypothetical protein FE78DRAFT_74772 [Acidomyces sp. 'richmondensis']
MTTNRLCQATTFIVDNELETRNREAPLANPSPTCPSGLHLLLIFVSLILALLLGGLDANILAPAIPHITDSFHTTANVGWYASSYRFAACAFQLFFGKCHKSFPAKWLFILSNVIFLLGSVLSAAAVSSGMFMLGRAVTGAGLGGSAGGLFVILLRVLPPAKRPLGMSLVGAVEGLATVVAPALGGMITQNLSWRWCFWINIPICSASILVLIFLLPLLPPSDHQPSRAWIETFHELDVLSTLILIPSLVSLFIALNWAGVTYAWHNPRIVVLFVIFGVLLAAFVWTQIWRGNEATIPIRVLRERDVVTAAWFGFCVASALNVVEYYLPTYFQIVQGWTPTHSGWMMLPLIIATIIGTLIQGSGTTLLGYYTPFMLLTSLLLPIATGVLTTCSSPTTSLSKLIVYPIFIGLGAGLGFLGPQHTVQTALPNSDAPLGLSLVLFAQNFGPAVFISVAQAVFTNRLSVNIPAHEGAVVRVENLGLNQLSIFDTAELDVAITASGKSVAQTWYLAAGLGECLLWDQR